MFHLQIIYNSILLYLYFNSTTSSSTVAIIILYNLKINLVDIITLFVNIFNLSIFLCANNKNAFRVLLIISMLIQQIEVILLHITLIQIQNYVLLFLNIFSIIQFFLKLNILIDILDDDLKNTLFDIFENDIIIHNINITKYLECSICLEEDDKEQYILECNHSFHIHCLNKWIYSSKKKKTDNIYHSTCPICRSNIIIFK